MRTLRPQKPRTVVDISTRDGVGPFAHISERIAFETTYAQARRFSARFVVPVAKVFLVVMIGSGMFGVWASAPISQSSLAAETVVEEEREALEAELREVEAQIEQYEDTISGLKTQQNTLKNELSRLEAKIAQINLRIKATSLSLEKLNADIEETRDQIETTESDIAFQKDALAEQLRVIYQEESASLVEVLMRNPQFSDFFLELNSLMVMQNTTQQTLATVTELKNKLIDQQEILSLERADVVALKEFNEQQRAQLDSTKAEKDYLLRVTRGEESKYQALLEKSEKDAAEIRSRIFSLLGGGELTFERALELAKLAEQATGVRAAMLLATLDRESALGKYVGSCPYYDADTNRYYMHPRRDVPPFLEITAELGLDPTSVKVSCPNSDGAYGGAMGPSQFIPSTWMMYKDRVGALTGANPPSPWNNTHAFIATGLFLADLGADRGTIAAEREAAARYYAGGRWRRYLWTYGDWVVSRANAYQKDIDLLDDF